MIRSICVLLAVLFRMDGTDGTTCLSSSSSPYTVNLTSTSLQFITSPNYPNNYYPSPGGNGYRLCYYKVVAPIGQTVGYRFAPDFRLHHASNCYSSVDYIHLYDANSLTNSIGRYCGWTEPAASVTSSRYLFIKFDYDYLNTYKGFKVGLRAGSAPSSSQVQSETADGSDSDTGSYLIGQIVGGVMGLLVVITLVVVFCRYAHKKFGSGEKGGKQNRVDSVVVTREARPPLPQQHQQQPPPPQQPAMYTLPSQQQKPSPPPQPPQQPVMYAQPQPAMYPPPQQPPMYPPVDPAYPPPPTQYPPGPTPY